MIQEEKSGREWRREKGISWTLPPRLSPGRHSVAQADFANLQLNGVARRCRCVVICAESREYWEHGEESQTRGCVGSRPA